MDLSAFSFSTTTARSSRDFTSPPGQPIQKLSKPLPASADTSPPAEDEKLMSLLPPAPCLMDIDTGSRLATISRRPLLPLPPLGLPLLALEADMAVEESAGAALVEAEVDEDVEAVMAAGRA